MASSTGLRTGQRREGGVVDLAGDRKALLGLELPDGRAGPDAEVAIHGARIEGPVDELELRRPHAERGWSVVPVEGVRMRSFVSYSLAAKSGPL